MAPTPVLLPGKIPWTEEPGRLQSMGSLRVGHDWATSLSVFTFMHWRRKWQPTPVFLPGESRGRGSLVGCRLWGRTESDTTEATWQQQQHQVCNLAALSTFPVLCNHYHVLVPDFLIVCNRHCTCGAVNSHPPHPRVASISVSLNLPIFGPLYKQDHTSFVLLCLTSFTWHNLFRVCLGLGMFQNLLLLWRLKSILLCASPVCPFTLGVTPQLFKAPCVPSHWKSHPSFLRPRVALHTGSDTPTF